MSNFNKFIFHYLYKCFFFISEKRLKTKLNAICKNETGKSMVEMLGVLAIIGVLSVGGISGYATAMFRLKLNKYATSYNTLLNDLLDIKNSLEKTDGVKTSSGSTVHYYGDYFKKLNMIPDGFKYVSNQSLEDVFHNNVQIYQFSAMTNQSNPDDFPGGIRTDIQPSREGHEICYQILKIAKENSQNLSRALIYKHYSSSSNRDEFSIYGDKKCVNGEKCLGNLTLTDMVGFCNVCDEKPCNVYLLWRG